MLFRFTSKIGIHALEFAGINDAIDFAIRYYRHTPVTITSTSHSMVKVTGFGVEIHSLNGQEPMFVEMQ